MADVVVRFVSEADDLLSDLQSVENASEFAAKGLAAMGTAVLAAGGAIATMAQQTADLRNELTDMSARTGIARDTLGGLRLAARASGGSLGELEGVLRKVTAEGLDLGETVSILQGIDDPAQRAAKAMELMGEEGGRLVQVLGDSSVDSFASFVREFGGESGPEAAAAAAEWQRNLAIIQTLIEGMVGDAAPLATLNGLLIDFGAGAVFIQELTTAFFDLNRTTDEALADATARAHEFRAAIAEIEGTTTEYVQVIDEMTGELVDIPLSEYRAQLEETEEATKKVQEATKKAREEFQKFLEDLDFKQLAGDMRQVIEVTDPLTGKTRELAIGYADAGANLSALQGTIVTDAMPAMQGLTYATEEEVAAAAKAAKEWSSWDDTLEATTGLLDSVAGFALMVGENAKEGSKAAEVAAKVAFAATKAAAIGEIVINTARSIMAAMTIPPPAGPILATAAGITGAANLATVVSTSFGGGGSAPSGPSSGGGAGGGLTSAAISGPKPGTAQMDGTTLRRVASTGGTMYRHRDLDVVAADGYPGSAFDGGIGYTGQRRQRVA